MPRVTVRLFAALRELAGSSSVQAEGASVGEVVEALSARYGERATPLTEGQEVALLPPVSGGYRRQGGP